MLARPRLDFTCKCQYRVVSVLLSQFFHYVQSRLLLLRYYRRVEYEIGASYTPVCTHHICISAVWTRERFGFARRYMITICTEVTRIDQPVRRYHSKLSIGRMKKKNYSRNCRAKERDINSSAARKINF